MGNSFKIGQAFGIDLKIHWAFFLLPLIVGFIAYQSAGSVVGTATSIGIIAALFVCVVLHELGHSVMAQRLGIDVEDITLLPIGGLARMKTIPEKPGDEVKIAIAGPLVNVVLAPIFIGAALLLGVDFSSFSGPLSGQPQSVAQILLLLGALNVFLAVFNMLPAFPMDGGRVLRGVLASWFGPVRATNISATVGQMLAVAGFILGIFITPVLILISIFVFFGASSETQMVRQRETMRGLSVADVMGTKRRTETITPYHNFGQVLDAVIHGYQEDFPVVDESGRVLGIVTRNEIMAASHSSDKFLTIRELMKTEFPTVSPEDDLFKDGQRVLQESGMRALPVLRDGEFVGMLTTEDIGQASLLKGTQK